MTEHALRPLLEPRSIAVVGASAREGTLGHTSVQQAIIGGLNGPIYPINPRYDSILETDCYASYAELPSPAELAVLAVGNERIEEQLCLALEHGAKAAVIFTSAYLENDEPPLLLERLRSIAREAGIPVCGANCLGLAQFEVGARATWFGHGQLEAGPISMISHSGTAYFSLAGLDPRMRYNFIVSPGQELVTTTADYIDYAVGLDSTRVIGILMEAIRDPEGFIAALDKANERNIPVVALKVGQTELSARLAQSHSGALAGNDAAYEAVFEHCGVQRVQSMDELSATLALFAAYPKLGPGKLAAVHDSGGLRGMVIDLAHHNGVAFADINQQTTDKLAATLAYGLPAVNPVDAWSGFADFEGIFGNCLDALSTDPNTALTLMFTDVAEGDTVSSRLCELPLLSSQRTGKPCALALNWSRQASMEKLSELTRRGMPILDGAENAIRAVKHAFDYRDFRQRAPVAAPAAPPGIVIDRWRSRLRDGRSLDEAESAALLGDFGVPVVANEVVSDIEGAVLAAAHFSYPVVLKTAMPDIAHKSDVDGVKAGLADEAAVRKAYTDIASRLGPRVLVSPMATGTVELALGVVVDEQFGPLVMIGAGGVLIEVLSDRRFILPPVDTAAAQRTLAKLKVAPLLDGVRGSQPVDRIALSQAVACLGVMASVLGDQLAEVDINPLIAGPDGCVAVDALVVQRASC
jgi:acyl-CoA synthetase (NDP forming)